MKKISVILLVAFSFVFAGFAEAAKPKKRTRNANRVGAYAGALVGYSTFSADGSAEDEIALEDTLIDSGADIQGLSSGTEESDIGYQAMFGYRFTRYFAAELGLAQLGSMSSSAHADMDFGEGFVPVTVKLSFSAGGPIVSAIGILPINDKFELFGRLGYIFTSAEREFSSRVDGRSGGSGGPKGDSQDPVYGIGFAWHINQVYSIRGEYQQLDSLGEPNRTGEEDVSLFGLGFIVRF
ncbi:MAG TPA: outer membrane beta-barrel protein [Steroidobacteraceae bacterium]|nr:outer membrane beta-barrel protein [Steroidobacteraceae bacterium]